MDKCLMKNIMFNNTSERVTTTTDSNSEFKCPDGLADDLLKALSSYKIVTEFRNKDLNADKLHQYEKVRKEMRKINKHYLKYF